MAKKQSILQFLESDEMSDIFEIMHKTHGKKLNETNMDLLKLMVAIIYTVWKMGAVKEKTSMILRDFAKAIVEDSKTLKMVEDMSMEALTKDGVIQELRGKISEKYLKVFYFLSLISSAAMDGSIISMDEGVKFKLAVATLLADDAAHNS